MLRRAAIPFLISSAVALLGGVMPAPTVFAASHPEIVAYVLDNVVPPITPSDMGQDFDRDFAITDPAGASLFTASYNGQSSEFSMNIDLAATTDFVDTSGNTANNFPAAGRLFIATYDGSLHQVVGGYNQIVYNPSLVAGQTYAGLTRACTKVVLKNNNQPVPIAMRIHLVGNERAGTYRVSIFGQGEFSELPTVPTNLTASVVAGPGVRLSWTASSVPKGTTLTGYKIYRNGGSTPIATVAAPTVTYTDNSVVSGTTYTYAVSAYNAAGDTDKCTPVSVTP